MSVLVKILWTGCSYAPLVLFSGIALLIDGYSTKKISNGNIIGFCLIGLALLSIFLCWLTIRTAKKKIAPSKLKFNGAESSDGNTLSNMIAYLLPMITLSLDSINIWLSIALIVIIILMVIWTRAVFTNPIVYLFGYRYYSVQAQSGMTYTLVTKCRRFNPQEEKIVIELFNEIYMEV